MHKRRIFRVLVCFVLICCILINCSPIRARATGVPVGISGSDVFFWLMLLLGGIVLLPTEIGMGEVGEAAQDYIHDWYVQAADDAAAASAELKESIQDFNHYLDDPDDYLDEDPLDDPRDYGFHIDKWGNVVMGGFLGAALLDWFDHIITNDGFEVEEEVDETAPDGYAYYNAELYPEPPEDISSYPYIVLAMTYDGTVSLAGSIQRGYWESSNKRVFFPSGQRSLYWLGNPWTLIMNDVAPFALTGTVIWSNYDILTEDGSLYFSGSDYTASKTLSQTTTVTPSTYFGDVPSQVQAGTFDPSSFQYPSRIDLNNVVSSKESALREMQELYNQIINNQYTYNQYVDQITYKDSVVDPGESEVTPTPDPSPPDQSEEPQPEEGEDEKGLDDFTLDLTDFFPFCLPFDIYEFVSLLAADPVAPCFEFTFDFGEHLGTHTLVIDLSQWDDTAQLLRRLELLLFIIGLAMATRNYYIRG